MTITERPASITDLHRTLDEAEVGRKHWLTVFTAGMGFFTDAYDLFIIGTVTVLLTPIFHLNTNQISFLNAASLLASVAGALTFGRLMDKLGRKKMYGVEISILVVGAILCAFAWNFTSLFVFRLLVGYGVGGDYATSAIITSEYANRKSRGKLVGTVFAMQGLGLLAGPLMASIFLSAGVSHGLAWRLMLGFGAIPAASVVYLRRRIKETPRFSLNIQGDEDSARTAVAWVTDSNPIVSCDDSTNTSSGDSSASIQDQASQPGAGLTRAVKVRLTDQPFLTRLIGTAGCWFLMDIAFYGNSVSSPLILKKLQPGGTLLSHTLISLAIFAVAAFPGYLVAVRMMDRKGRKSIQIQGFLIMALAFGLIWLVPGVSSNVAIFLALFSISYFFIEYGPNQTTFVYPSEIFPTSVRGMGDGISAGAGKMGAFIGALMVPHLLKSIGLSGVMGIMAVVSVLGALLTIIALPEPMGKSLEEASCEVFSDELVERQAV